MTSAGPGLLSILATPIGHLDDITLRALSTLRKAHVVLAEDTRRTRKLLTHHGISAKVRALHAHSTPAVIARAVDELLGGVHLALVTDAGTPLVSDPGQALVSAAAEAGVKVEAIPGPSAVLAALCTSGLPFSEFRFAGFPPRSGGKRSEWLARLAADTGAQVLFEAPTRLANTLSELSRLLAPERRVAVCRELTKLHEEVVRGSASELAEHFALGARGEITVVIGAGQARSTAEPAQEGPSRAERIQALLEAGVSARDVARQLATELGASRRELYAQVLTIVAKRNS
jgi:16S rRNA (cytidine1402-2'-O)-methyltransferase